MVMGHDGVPPRSRLEQGDKGLQPELELRHDPSPSLWPGRRLPQCVRRLTWGRILGRDNSVRTLWPGVKTSSSGTMRSNATRSACRLMARSSCAAVAAAPDLWLGGDSSRARMKIRCTRDTLGSVQAGS
jgi:hypothetical protein